jgi:hypothetical protein
MSKVYKKQTNITLTLDTGIDLTVGVTEAKILFNKPNGEKGEWTGIVSGSTLSHTFVDGDIDRDGMWKFQAYVVKGGKKHYGEITEKYFYKPLN